MLSALVFVYQRKTWPGRLLVLLALSLSALIFRHSALLLDFSRDTVFVIGLFDVPNTVFVWLFVISLLTSKFQMNWIYWALGALWCLPLWFLRLSLHLRLDSFNPIYVTALNIYGLCLFLYLGYIVVRDWPSDLVERRRRLRLAFVILIIVTAIIAIGTEALLFQDRLADAMIAKLFAIYPSLIAAYFWILKIPENQFQFDKTEIKSPKSAKLRLSCEKTRQLRDKLYAEMDVVEAWKEPKLTIPKLAKRLGTTQHVLRTVINQDLGYQNFRDYINYYRIKAITAVFDDREFDSVPILTIAMDHGFNTLPPFNRAFKLHYNMTPSQYRARKLAETKD